MVKYNLSQVADVAVGQSAPQGDAFSAQGTPFIRAGSLVELLGGKCESEFELVSEEVAKKHKLKLFPQGTILFAKSGMSCMKGYVYELKQPCYVVSHLACVITKGVDLSRYLKYFFNYHKPNKLVKDEAYPSISLEDIKSMELFLPSYANQERIAWQLDIVCGILAKQKRQYKLFDDLIKSKFNQMFGDIKQNNLNWDIVSFQTAAIIDTKMTSDFEYYADDPHIGIENIEKDTGKLIGYKKVKESGLISGKYAFDNRHIIYSKIRPNLNKVALPTFRGLCSADAYPILPTNLANRTYLAYVLRSETFLDFILKSSSRTNIPKVNKQQLQAYSLPLPPLALQKQFANFVTQVEQSKAKLKAEMEQTETLYKALMQKYFGDKEAAA